jgi:hypothetical protein
MPTHLRRREVKCASDEETCARRERERERERERSACRQMGVERAGGGHPPRSVTSGEGENKKETTLPPLSSLHITHPLLLDVVCRQVGNTGGEHQLKHPRAGTEPPIDSPEQLLPT